MNSAATSPPMKLDEMKDLILRRRRQRIRRSTYDYVAALMIEDTAFNNPHRDRMVLDWWARVVDPLEAEKFDQKRLRYFRQRLKEHAEAPSVNAAIRQGLSKRKPLRRLAGPKLQYVKHQVKRLSDRRKNPAAAGVALDNTDAVFERMALGLIALPTFSPGPKGFLQRVVTNVSSDRRFHGLISAVRKDPSSMLPGLSVATVEKRIARMSDPYDPFWAVETNYLFERRQAALIQKLEREYISKIK